MFFFEKPRWKKVEYSKAQINDAGDIVRNENTTKQQRQKAITIIDNWRASHAYPLHVIYVHLRRRFGTRSNVIVVERIKRLDSIISKLRREKKMNLWRMQDLGGCRVIVPYVEQLYEYVDEFKSSRVRHKLIRTYDYVGNPKISGYRCLHLVYQYYSDNKDTYNRNMLIEIQFRTHLQHVWATAVETIGLFTNQALKAGVGNNEIKRFFVIISSLFAIKERCPLVPNTVANEKKLISEMMQLNEKHHILDMISGIRKAADYVGKNLTERGNSYYILKLNYNTHMLRIFHFKPSQIEQANIVYTKLERQKENENIDVVLVRSESFQTLKLAYPNYFSDIGEFVDIVNDYLDCTIEEKIS